MCAVGVPAVAAVFVGLLDSRLGIASESALFFVVVLAVSMLGGIGPAALSAIVSGLLLNYFFTSPRHSFTIKEVDNLITIIVLLVVAIAVAALVDLAAVRRVQGSTRRTRRRTDGDLRRRRTERRRPRRSAGTGLRTAEQEACRSCGSVIASRTP